MSFYETQQERYRNATTEARTASRKHWLDVHAKNIASGRNDLIIFSAQILAAYDLVDAETN